MKSTNSSPAAVVVLLRGENEALLEFRFTWFLGQFTPFYTNRNHSEKFQDMKLSRKKITLFILQLTVGYL